MLLHEVSSAAPIFSLAPALVFLPLVGFLINLIFGKRMREGWVGAVASLAVGLTFVLALIFAITLAGNPASVSYPFLEWIRIGTFVVNWAFRIDTLSVTMMLVVSGVGTLIHIYAIGYMHEDVRHNDDPGRFRRFFVYLNLFIAMMMILISADNYLMLFVGWEGVGLCSYLLIGFWFEKGKGGIANAQAAKNAFVVNRVGDFGLLIALFLMFGYFGSLDFVTVFEKAPEVAKAMPGVLLAMTLFMLLGVTGKSAQIPLYVWLPDAMAGPTPVSALIHAATMVTAGVYLVVRSTPLFELAPMAQAAVMWVGAATAFFAATIALGQSDIKKVLAYSTVSQLGFMVAAAGMGAGVAAMFHLMTHAFFKALLFLGAGSVILGMEHGAEHGSHGSHGAHHDLDPQDMRNMGGLRKRMPLTFAVYLIGALALAGIAPLAGFFSKDEIILAAQNHNMGVFGLLIVSAFLTAFYMGRQLLLIFFGTPRTEAAGAAVESQPVVTTPLVILAVLSVLGGGLNLPGVYSLEHWLEHSLEHIPAGEFSLVTAGISLSVALLGLFLAYLVYGRKFSQKPQNDPLSGNFLYTMLENKWKIDELYDAVIIRPYRGLANFLSGPIDLGIINNISGGLAWLMQASAEVIRGIQTGFVRTYALAVFLGVVLILVFILVK
jgi:NADH-quinone oxidoreductase subunit L